MTDTMPPGPLFPYGRAVATPGALAALSLASVAPEACWTGMSAATGASCAKTTGG